MKIAFVLPMPTMKIVGGYKKVYEYANYLSNRGNKVTIFFNSDRGTNSKKLPKFLVFFLRNLIVVREPSWFKLDKNVKKKNLYRLKEKYFDDFDVVIATAAKTSKFVNKLNNSKKLYLIQGYEKGWDLSERELIDTYRYDMKKVVVSKWLKKIVDRYTKKKTIYVPNGINTTIFYDT